MPPIIEFSAAERRQSMRNISLQLAAGWLGTDVLLVALYLWVLPAMPEPALGERLQTLMQWQVWPLLLLLAMVYTVIVQRGLNPEAAIYPLETAASGQDGRIARHNAVLRNTVEQWVIFLPALVLLSLYLGSQDSLLDMRVVPLLTLTFVLGRLLYWLGYVRDSISRVFGIAMTLHLSLYMVLYALFQQFAG